MKDLTVEEVIATMTDKQKNTLYLYVGNALKTKQRTKPPYAGLETFDENQTKVFYYLVGLALETRDEDILEIVKRGK